MKTSDCHTFCIVGYGMIWDIVLSKVWERFMHCTSFVYPRKYHSKSNFNYIIFVIMEITTPRIFCVACLKDVSGILDKVYCIDLQK